MARQTVDDWRPPSSVSPALWQCVQSETERAPKARAGDPPTSHEAGAKSETFAAGHRAAILAALVEGPASKTVLAARTGIDGVAVARRMKELLDAGSVVVVSGDGVSATGNRERVYGLAGGAR